MDESTKAPDKIPPPTRSLKDLTIIEAWDTETNKPRYVTFYHVTPDEEMFFGQSTKPKMELSFAEFTAALHYVQDEEIYPEVPKDVNLKLAPDDIDDSLVYVKRPGLAHNDINPHNIMVKDAMRVLIDFGSCQPVGQRLQSLATEGWYEELFFTSETKHDTSSLNKLREWIQNYE
ncbi:uncharacterized protein FPRN_01998 [Fusarium proliferatum]|nr:uncharacterized protein FPRN_01998 [Fusarium proliferatum]